MNFKNIETFTSRPIFFIWNIAKHTDRIYSGEKIVEVYRSIA